LPVIACIEDPRVIKQILDHLKYQAQTSGPGALAQSRAPPAGWVTGAGWLTSPSSNGSNQPAALLPLWQGLVMPDGGALPMVAKRGGVSATLAP